MNRYTKQTAEQVLKQLNLPAAVMQIFDKGGAGIHPLLANYREPYYNFSSWDAIAYPDIVPIWEDGVVLTAYDRMRDGFVRFSLEAPGEEWFFYSDFNGIAAEALIMLLEDEDATDEALDEVAELLAFPHLRLLLESYDAADHRTFAEHKRWIKAFMLSIGAIR